MRKTSEYAILAGVAHQARSGYDLASWLAQVASHFWPVAHSGIYPALAALEADGLVRHETLPSEQGPPRKVYALTPEGREVLLAWVDTPAGAAQARDDQLVRALCYGFLPPERALSRLAQVRDDHAARLARYEALEGQIRRDADAAGAVGPAEIGKLLVVRRGILNEQSYLQWCDEAAAIVAARTPVEGRR